MSYGMGLMCGPIIGGYLYEKFSYEVPFVFTGLMTFIPVLFIYASIPASVDQPVVSPSGSVEDEEESVWQMSVKCLKVPRMVFAMSIHVLMNIEYTFLEPIMAIHLEHQYGATLYQNNIIFALMPTFFMVGAILFQFLVI
jgi:MFS family permease